MAKAGRKKRTRRYTSTKKTNALNFVRGAHSAIRSHLRDAVELPEFMATTDNLTLRQRQTLVRQALVLMRENFVHLPLKQAMHGINPVQKLSLLEHRLDQASDKTMGSEYAFHREMIEIFNSVRDLHTNYLLPAPFCNHIAFMPFSIEEYFEGDKPGYIATHIVEGFTHSHFKKGVEIVHWNAVPIDRAIDIAANLHAGSNNAARHARGIDGLTMRALKSTLPPDENWVIVGYRDAKGEQREMRQEWIISSLLPKSEGFDADLPSEASAALGMDIDADIQQQARKMLFAPQVIAAENKKTTKLEKAPCAAGDSLTSTLAGVFRAKSVVTEKGAYGHIRIYTFNVVDPTGFVEEFIRLVSLLPKEGLIIDVRGNGGGHIMAAEGLLQTLTPYEITPEPAQFINTPLNAAICRQHRHSPKGIDLGPWHESIRDAITTGAIYSRAFPITSPQFANQWGQQYHGPVVLITDARCYSATDIFAAGFQDHGIGTILGVDNNTGAGGANVWTHGLLKKLSEHGNKRSSVYTTLPENANMRVAIRRTLRVGERSGTPVEDIGVTPDEHHTMSKRDLLEGNIDLLNRAAEELQKLPMRQLDVEVRLTDTLCQLNTSTVGLDRLDIYVDERPMTSEFVEDGHTDIAVPVPSDATLIVVAGYQSGEFVAARNLLV